MREVDGVVLRSPGPQSKTVLALLRHLESVGFDAAPRVIGDGFAPDGREMLKFIEGETQHPHPWSDEALVRVAVLLRAAHDATATFDVPDDATWRPSFIRDLPGDTPVIGHGDLGPWNILARDGQPVAFIDWDDAAPFDALWEVAQVAWLNVQLTTTTWPSGTDYPTYRLVPRSCAPSSTGMASRVSDERTCSTG